jgi:acyl carrier protein
MRRHCNTPKTFLVASHCNADLSARICALNEAGGLVMTFSSLSSTQRTSASKESLEGNKVRTLVAKHLQVDVKHVTDEAHFRDDLGADWLDRLELMMLIEDKFAGAEITDDDADQMEAIVDAGWLRNEQ